MGRVERMRRALIGTLLLLLAGAASCGDGSLDPLPLEISIQASRATATTGQTVNFVVNAQGGHLVGVGIDYGDESSDLLTIRDARTAQVTFQHAYSTAGTYQVRATVADAIAGTKDATVQLIVQ